MRESVVTVPERLSEANRLTWDLSDPLGEDRKWRETKFCKLPTLFQKPAAVEYRKLYETQGRTAANTFLRLLVDELNFANIELAIDEDAVKAFARNRTQEIDAICSRSQTSEEAYSSACELVNVSGLNAPTLEGMTTEETALARMRDQRWWKRQIRKAYPRRFEAAAIRCGMVHAKADLYVSNESFRAHESRQARNAATLAKLDLVNEEGDVYSLEQLVALSVSNPSNRRNELMARLHGFDMNAKEKDHMGLFITITCPSRMHARYGKTGDANAKYDKTTPRQAQQYLCTLWQRIRANLKHANIHMYGFRVAEPQHDGTPHWHILLYTEASNEVVVKETVLRHALADSPNEKGAAERRCTFKTIDWSLGSGIGYIAKYISKNIDGAHVEADLHGQDAKQSAKRVRAWASIHGIRQFQQFGGPSVTCWRECRKAAIAPRGILESAKQAANEGDWKAFTDVLGGTEINRRSQLVQLEKEFSAECGLYGEPKGFLITGVTDGLEVLQTRLHSWTMLKRGEAVRGAAPARPALGFAHLEFCQ
ncbi:MAG: replication endonuclease [Gammaproteobacteria bacterium]|nr:replication endonuclease [Gammaproteobacteria bacterium]MDP2349064.1 replication endonuclease [Gammaproteobacteria bacterium]